MGKRMLKTYGCHVVAIWNLRSLPSFTSCLRHSLILSPVAFRVAPFDLFLSQLLAGGDVLAIQSQDDHTAAMKRNMKAYLMAQLMANTQMVLLLDNILEACDTGDINDGTQCRRFGYRQPHVGPTASTIDRPGNILAVGGFGFSLAEISDNTVSSL